MVATKSKPPFRKRQSQRGGNKTEIIYYVVEARLDAVTADVSYVLVKRSAWRGPRVTFADGSRYSNDEFDRRFDTDIVDAVNRVRRNADEHVKSAERKFAEARVRRNLIYAATTGPIEPRDLTDATIAARIAASKARTAEARARTKSQNDEEE